MAPPPDPSTPLQDPSPDPNPNPNHRKPNVYQIGGVPVEFPYKPYGTQLAYMGRVISTLERARRQGHCHALLESPTGTGKSLSLLCSALAWQQHHKLQRSAQPQPPPQPPTVAPQMPPPDPLLHGGGFVPEPGPSEHPTPSSSASTARVSKKAAAAPIIYYATRTHAQITQVIREYRKTSYRVPMAILASRKHYCTNKNVRTSGNVDDACKLLLKNPSEGCLQFKNAHKVKTHASLYRGGCNEVHDIEDLVKVARSVRGCAYFAAQVMASVAHIVFTPYSYVINPVVRRAMDIDIKGSILIFDEAHNIEDIARESGSIDIDEEVLHTLQTELGQLAGADGLAMTYQPLYDVIQGLNNWIAYRKDSLQNRDFEHYASYWTGDKAMRELKDAGITEQCFPILQECATKAVKAASDEESDGACLSGTSAAILEGLFSALSYFFSGNGSHSWDYQLRLQRYINRNDGHSAVGWKCAMSLWCLNPAVVFQEIAHLSLSVILTSGTLSPMGSFASELGVQFEACLEAPHIIDVDLQLWAAVVSVGLEKSRLNASYKTADGFAFQDALGASLEEICKVVPGGALVFFPSYKLLDKLHARWGQTGQWSRLNAHKPVFVEPRGSIEEFEPILKDYYDAILGKNKTATRKAPSGSKQILIKCAPKGSPTSSVGGAAFLAVCRGKVSEGIDFSDENARVVVIVGIPFPNINDDQIILKKKYNDTFRSSKGLLSGSEWYCHQAFRALNQAAGRCIRHRFDYGAIVFLDERYQEERNLAYISKWLRNSIKHYGSFEETLDGLRSFFGSAQKRINEETKDASSNDGMMPCSKQNSLNQGKSQKKRQKTKLNHQNVREKSLDNRVATKLKNLVKCSTPISDKAHVSSLKTPCSLVAKPDTDTDEEVLENYSSCAINDITPQSCRYSTITSVASDEYCLQQSPIAEQCTLRDQSAARGVSEGQNLHSRMVGCNRLLSGTSFSVSNSSSNGHLSDDLCITTVTPRRVPFIDLGHSDAESPISMSVNSDHQKRRKFITSSTTFTSSDHVSYPDGKSSCQIDSTGHNTLIDVKISYIPSANDGLPPSNQRFNREFVEQDSDTQLLPHHQPTQEMLHLSCSRCKKPLGLSENNFLVPCLLSSSSKVFLTNVLKHGSRGISLSDSLPRMPHVEVQTVGCEISSVNHCVFSGSSTEGAARQGIWSEEDGCVFKMVTCPFCTASPACLGVQVMATDASNVGLLNKVLFYADSLEIKHHRSKEKAFLPKSADLTAQSSPVVEIENYAYNPQPLNPEQLKSRTSVAMPPKNADFGARRLLPIEIEEFAYNPQAQDVHLNSRKSKLKLTKRSQ